MPNDRVIASNDGVISFGSSPNSFCIGYTCINEQNLAELKSTYRSSFFTPFSLDTVVIVAIVVLGIRSIARAITRAFTETDKDWIIHRENVLRAIEKRRERFMEQIQVLPDTDILDNTKSKRVRD